MTDVKKILIVSADKHLKEILHFCFQGWGYEVFLHGMPITDIEVKKISPDVIVIDLNTARKEQLEFCHALKKDFTTNLIPMITLINKRQLRQQLLDLKYGVDDYLIKPPDPLDLRVRIEMAIKRAQYSFYSSPLTALPGGRIIEDVLNERIKKNAPFSFGYIDIDNFKYFNDVYGYLKGDSVILQTAHLLYSTVKALPSKDAVIGHIGGDDFVFVAAPGEYEDICGHFIAAFDKLIPFHYSAQDRTQGFIVARDRTHTVKKIPLMSVSVAVVNRTAATELKTTIEINERIAEIKKYLKNIDGSKFMAERRNTNMRGAPLPGRAKMHVVPAYKPLGQILLERGWVTFEQLTEALRTHWQKDILLGEVLTELGFVGAAELREALAAQEALVHSGK